MKLLLTLVSVALLLSLIIFGFTKTSLDNSAESKLAICYNPKAINQSNDSNTNVAESSGTIWLFDTSQWPARWSCGEWSSLQGWTSIISDLTIFVSYFGIPIGILFFLLRTKFSDFTFKKLLFLFTLFILSCGLTHLMDAWLFWKPFYNISISLKFITAVISATTFFYLIKATPQMLSLKSPEQLEKIIEAQTEKLKDQNNRLAQEIEDRKQIEHELSIALENNKVLYKENQHRMKNNLQMISSLLFIRSADKSEEVKMDFHEVAERINSINKVNELLLKADPASNINVNEYFKDMTYELSRIYHKVDIHIEIKIEKGLELMASYVMLCGLIYSEFYSNSVKHAFDKTSHPTINLSIAKTEQLITLSISDNGCGFDDKIEKVGSFGIGLIESFVQELNGKKELNSKIDQGTKLDITFELED